MKKMRNSFFIGFIVMIITIISVLYIGFVWGLIQPISNVAKAIDNNTISAGLIAGELIKFLLREIIASIIGIAGYFLTFYFWSK